MEFGMPYLLEMPSVEACCQLAKELGLSFVELNANFPICASERLDPSELRRLSERYGLFFTYHVEEECNPFAFNDAVRCAWLETLRHALTLARSLDMPIVNMHLPSGVYITLPGRRTYLFAEYEQEYRRAMAEFRGLCEDVLNGSDTRIVIENTDGWQPHEHRAIEDLLESPVFGLTLDVGHSHAASDADEAFFRAHDDRLLHMHGHDALGKRNHLTLGDGEIDLRERFAWAARRSARIVLETKTIAALRTSVVRLPEILAEMREKV